MYAITEEDADQEILLRYEDQCITEFYGHYIPNIDVEMIEFYAMDIDKELIETREDLRKLIILAMGVDSVSKEEVNTLLEALKIIGNFATDDDIYYDLSKEDVYNNSILYAPMDEYLEQMRIFKDMKEQRRLWLYQLYKDDDFPMMPGGASVL